MAKLTLEETVAMLNVGGWRLESARVEERMVDFNVDLSQVIAGVGTLSFQSKSSTTIYCRSTDRLQATVDNRDRPTQITVKGPFTVQQQRKQVEGGGYKSVEQTDVVMRFQHRANSDAALKEKSEADSRRRQEELKRQAALPKSPKLTPEQKQQRRDEETRKHVLGQTTKSGVAACLIVWCNRRERIDCRRINNAFRVLFNGADLPKVYDLDTQEDEDFYVVSSLPLTRDEVDAVWKRFIALDDWMEMNVSAHE